VSWASELAERALEAAPAGDAIAQVTAERSLTMRFARTRPTQSTAIDDVTVLVAVERDGRVGSATTNLVDPGSLAACGRAAAAAAEAAARTAGTGAFPGFPAAGPARAHEGFDAATAALDPAAGGGALEAAFAECTARGAEAHGTWSAGDVSIGVASRAGAHGADRMTDVFMKVTAFGPGGRSGFAEGTAVSLDGIDPEALAARATSKALISGEPARLPPGEYPVVLEADAVGELLSWLGALAHNGLAYAEGRSALCDRLGSRVTAARINLSDSPRFARTLPRALDAEGVTKAPLPLIEDGVAHRIVHDTRSAAIAGGDARSTGHALVPGGDSFGPMPTNLVLIGGGARDEEELALPIERGIYVTRLWYTNPIREKETLLTGVTRDGTFLIEDGHVTSPIEDMRMTDSVLGVLERCTELGARARLTSEGEFYGRRFAVGVVCPPMRSVMRFTG
jgi:predicted Zn-dependent protease